MVTTHWVFEGSHYIKLTSDLQYSHSVSLCDESCREFLVKPSRMPMTPDAQNI